MTKHPEDISGRTIGRMAVYYNILEKMREEGETVCSSNRLEQQTGIASSVVRRDLSYFGGFGTKGVGYDIGFLVPWLAEILGYKTVWSAAFVGWGMPVAGFGSYNGVLPPGFRITAVVDLAIKKQGRKISELGLTVNPLGKLASLIESQQISIGIVSVPPTEAQRVVNIMVKAGIKGIANFSPIPVRVPENVSLSHVNVTSCLSRLSYNLSVGASAVMPSLIQNTELDFVLGY